MWALLSMEVLMMKKRNQYLVSALSITLLSTGMYGFYNNDEQSTSVKATSSEEEIVASKEEITVKALQQEKTPISEIKNVGPWPYEEGVKYAVQGTFPSYSFEELSGKADLIVEGKPTAILEEYMVDGDVLLQNSLLK